VALSFLRKVIMTVIQILILIVLIFNVVISFSGKPSKLREGLGWGTALLWYLIYLGK
jgi:hypothetical protein